VIRIDPTPGYENTSTIVLKGHMDMVCEKMPDSRHDFSKDPIRCVIEGEWLHADNTTLGADNDIAIGLAVALVENPKVFHPILELLFTVEEEISLGGAVHLPKGFISGKILVNLASEEDVFIIGCACGIKSNIELPLTFSPIMDKEQAYKITINGLKGGHSGVDIHKNRASANKSLTRLLGDLIETVPFRKADIRGGTAHNAIAREAEVTTLIDNTNKTRLESKIAPFQQVLMDELIGSVDSINFRLTDAQAENAVTDLDSKKIVALLEALPHGVFKMLTTIAGFEETSHNLATLEMKNSKLVIVSSQRSILDSQLVEITRRISAIAHLSGAEVLQVDHYPAWNPKLNSSLWSVVARSMNNYLEPLPALKPFMLA